MVVHEDDQHNDGGAHEGSKDGLTKNQYHRLREFLLSTNRPAKVFREASLWPALSSPATEVSQRKAVPCWLAACLPECALGMCFDSLD